MIFTCAHIQIFFFFNRISLVTTSKFIYFLNLKYPSRVIIHWLATKYFSMHLGIAFYL